MTTPETTTILIVDDDSTTRLVLKKILESEGYRVIDADRGEKALFLAMQRQIDVFILDINMPGLSGISICKRLRMMDKYRITPVIFITSSDEEKMLRDAFSAGACDFITKPASSIVLMARVQSHLQRIEYFRELERIRHYSNHYISSRTRRMVEAYSLTGFLPNPELHDVCVMFTDIRGFTALSRRIDLNLLFEGLSMHLGIQAEKVDLHGGYVDKFNGDGLMAVFEGDKPAVQACACALDILESSKQFTHIAEGASLPVGIGLHYGKVMIGNLGTKGQLDYSAIGDTVNLAARICANSLAMQASVSAEVVNNIPNNHDLPIHFEGPQTVQLKGVQDGLQVYRLVQK